MICDDCKQEPSIYGDGLSWGRCAKCQYKHNQDNKIEEPKDPNPIEEGIPHQTIPGRVSIILPVYMNNYALFHYTGNCIGSIREHTGIDYELIVIDNGSPIKPPNLQSYYADKVIQNETNLGVTKAWNQGIRASFGEYIVLLNNDTQIFEGTLEMMMECLEAVDLVMATPMYSNTEPFARAREANQIRDRWTKQSVQESFSDFRDFSCVMFKKELVDEIGLFDEDFFSYCSDSDFLKRMELAGKKFVSCKAVATHHVSDATGASINETPDLMNKDKATYAAKWEDQKSSNLNSPDIKFIRTAETGDRIYYIKGGQAFPLSNPETLKALGGEFGQETTITKEEFSKFKAGPLLTMENIAQYA